MKADVITDYRENDESNIVLFFVHFKRTIDHHFMQETTRPLKTKKRADTREYTEKKQSKRHSNVDIGYFIIPL